MGWEGSIKMDLGGMGWDAMDWKHFSSVRD